VGKKLGNFLWHIFTDYFVDALKEVKRLWDEIEVDRLQPKAKGKDHRGVLASDPRKETETTT
jgi:hypothetical protein